MARSVFTGTDHIWTFIHRNVVGLLTVIAGLVALLLIELGVLRPDVAPRVTLALVALLATTHVVEQSRATARIQDSLDRYVLRDAEVHERSVLDDAFHYVAKRFRSVARTVDHAALAPLLPRWPQRNEYIDARENLLRRNDVRYRYLVGGTDERGRREFAAQLARDTGALQLRTRSVGGGTAWAGFSFMVIDGDEKDKNEVLLYLPRTDSNEEKMLAIRNSVVIKHFKEYFVRLWNDAQRINGTDASDSNGSSTREGAGTH